MSFHVLIRCDTKRQPDALLIFLKRVLAEQVRSQTPIVTVDVGELTSGVISALRDFFSAISYDTLVTDKQVKISAFGDWTDIDETFGDIVTDAIVATKDYDGHFFNVAMDYDGQKDIVEAAKILARRVKAGKMNITDITADSVRENLETSFFVPPEQIILLDSITLMGNALLFDSGRATLSLIDSPFHSWEISL